LYRHISTILNWGLRKYEGDQGVEWPAVEYSPMPGLPPITIEPMRCDLGLEPTPEAYIGHLMLVMREMWRVLSGSGTAWVNLGDSYASSGNHGRISDKSALNGGSGPGKKYEIGTMGRAPTPHGLKTKDLCMIPQRFALAAQADGWWVRSEIIWAKKAPMPESVTDRPTRSHEQIWLLTKQPQYFYDAEAVREPLKRGSCGSSFTSGKTLVNGQGRVSTKERTEPSGRNRRDVWHLGPSPYPGAHFATFPPIIPETCIQAGTSARGVCPECGNPWVRVVEREFVPQPDVKDAAKLLKGSNKGMATENGWGDTPRGTTCSSTVGWEPTCECDAEPIPATVLDPFVGSGTTVQAAVKLGRHAIGVDISGEYLNTLVPERLKNTQLALI
jgi:DNA modification methylase